MSKKNDDLKRTKILFLLKDIIYITACKVSDSTISIETGEDVNFSTLTSLSKIFDTDTIQINAQTVTSGCCSECSSTYPTILIYIFNAKI